MEDSSFVEPTSSTPLSIKLGIVPGATLVVLHAPRSFTIDLPPDVTVARRRRRRADVVITFLVHRDAFATELEPLSRMIYPSGGLWVAWPKKSSGVATTLNDDVVRELALAMGLVDNKVCAIDSTWTGLRLVWRTTLRRSKDEEFEASRISSSSRLRRRDPSH